MWVVVLLVVHVVLTDVDDQLVREDTVRRRRTFSRNSRWLLPLQCTLQLATVSKPLPIAEGGGRMGTVALTDRAYGLGISSSGELEPKWQFCHFGCSLHPSERITRSLICYTKKSLKEFV